MLRFQALIVFALVFLKMAFAEHQEVEKWATLLLKLLSVLLLPVYLFIKIYVVLRLLHGKDITIQ